MTKKTLKQFLYAKSNLINAINGYLFLYEGQNYENGNKFEKLARLKKHLSKILTDKVTAKEYIKSLKGAKTDTAEKFINFVKAITEQNTEYANYIKNLQEIYKSYLSDLKSIKSVIVSEAPPIILNKKGIMEVKYILDPSIKNGGNYRNEIYKAFNTSKIGITAEDLKKTLIKNNVGFIDLIPIPLPFYSKLRTKWSTDKKFEIDGKPLPLLLLELAFEENFSKKKISMDVNICFMMPVNTSMGIIDYSKNNEYNINITTKIFIPHNRIYANNSETKISTTIRGLRKLVLPLHKRNSFSSGNTPNYLLIKNALE